jgi:hypothetical protein
MGTSFILILLIALVPARPISEPIVVSAYRTPQGVLFNPPRELPWDTLVPVHLRPAALSADHARRQRLFRARSEEYGFTEATFTLALLPDLEGRSYYLLDSAGVHVARPAGMLGTARIYWTGAGEVQEIRAYGQLVAPAPPGSNGGFVLSTENPVTLVLEPSRLSADELLAPRGTGYAHRGTSFWEIVRQYRVRQTAPAADSWIWVQWLSDTAMVEIGCGFRFSLFHTEREPVPVGSTDYGCDV